jgi:hypothetical protein
MLMTTMLSVVATAFFLQERCFGCGFGVRVMWHHFVLRIYMYSSKPKTSSSLRQEEEEDDDDDDDEQKTSGQSLSRFCVLFFCLPQESVAAAAAFSPSA